MEVITLILLGALVCAFIGAVLTDKWEFSIMSILLTFCSFVAIGKDPDVVGDMAMLLYVPIISIGLFSVTQFFKAKV